jgi:hypothetical protein
MAQYDKNLDAHDKDTVEDLIEKNRKLQSKIRKLQSQNRKVKSENKTLVSAWEKTEDFLTELLNGKSLIDMINAVKKGTFEKQDRCPKCNRKGVHTLQFEGFKILVCPNCQHRERADEPIE